MQLTRIYHNVLVVYLAFWHQRWLRLLQVTWHSKEMDRCLFTYENPHLEISNCFTNPNCSSKITEDIKMSHFILTIWGETFTKTFLKKCLEWPTYQDWRIDRQNNIQARVIYLLGLPPTCFSFFNISWELGFFHLLCAAWKAKQVPLNSFDWAFWMEPTAPPWLWGGSLGDCGMEPLTLATCLPCSPAFLKYLKSTLSFLIKGEPWCMINCPG